MLTTLQEIEEYRETVKTIAARRHAMARSERLRRLLKVPEDATPTYRTGGTPEGDEEFRQHLLKLLAEAEAEEEAEEEARSQIPAPVETVAPVRKSRRAA